MTKDTDGDGKIDVWGYDQGPTYDMMIA